MGYWDSKEVVKKLKEAYKQFSPKQYNKPNKKKGKLWRKLARQSPSTSFEAMYLVCFEFKKKFFNQPKMLKLKALIKLSKQTFANSRTYADRRAKKHPVHISKKCWVCNGKANIQHHIILIKNGGYDNGINRINICNKCHEEIHDWMSTVRKEKEFLEEYEQVVELAYT